MAGVVDTLKEAFENVALSAVLRERLALAADRFKDLEAENTRLKEQVRALTTENEALKKQIKEIPVATAPPQEQPAESGGIYYFGRDHNKPVCPKCWEEKQKKHPMARVGSLAMKCSVCGNVVYTH